jgi:aprataxin
MSNLTILRRYAQKTHPENLPSSVLLAHTPTSLTLFDAFPKSVFHLLILPRVIPPLTVFDLASLRTLLKCNRERAKEVLAGLQEDAKAARTMIEDEMMKRYGFTWGIWTGFHGAPSMEYVIVCLPCHFERSAKYAY